MLLLSRESAEGDQSSDAFTTRVQDVSLAPIPSGISAHITLKLPRFDTDEEPAAARGLGGIGTHLTLRAPAPEALDAVEAPAPSGIGAHLAIQPVETPRLEPTAPSLATVPLTAGAEPNWQTERVRNGDSLARIFHRNGLRAAELQAILDSDPLARRLTRIHPGEVLKYQTDDAGRLLAVRYEFSRLEAVESVRADAGSRFATQLVKRTPETRLAFSEGRIESSLFVAAARSGLDDATIMELANVFQWDIDFVHDIRRGDSFHVVHEERWFDGEKIGNGPIVAAEFVNRGRSHRAVRYTDSEGRTDYYADDGRSMRRAFLRAPVEFSRISSNFNMRRMHPIQNRVMPHRGIDYAAPTGTPVAAAGDGVVTTAASHHANGNYIVVRHGEQYQTRYLHLSRFGRGIRSGARVRQGQVIGYVGMTGWATGPHLHYEFLVNGVHQNPRTVNLPQAEPIAERERARFMETTRPLLAKLSAKPSDEQLALSESDDSGSGG